MSNIFVAVCCLSTAIAIFSVFTAGHSLFQRRLLPLTGGALLGIGLFWILPEIADDQGWMLSLPCVCIVLLVLGLIDRYIYPICPFCAAGMHCHEPDGLLRTGWPLLAIGCVHSLFDGWTIALSHAVSAPNSVAALFWGATIHKIPESMAIGLLAARLTSNRKMALAAVGLVQTAMAAGGGLAIFVGQVDSRLANLSTIPACALLLLFGILAVEQEWRLHGRTPAMRAAAPGLLGCGLTALAGAMLAR